MSVVAVGLFNKWQQWWRCHFCKIDACVAMAAATVHLNAVKGAAAQINYNKSRCMISESNISPRSISQIKLARSIKKTTKIKTKNTFSLFQCLIHQPSVFSLLGAQWWTTCMRHPSNGHDAFRKIKAIESYLAAICFGPCAEFLKY
jgi:hypothetical protein